MKKKIFLCSLILAAGAGVFLSNKSSKGIQKSDAILDNVEALASFETQTSWQCVTIEDLNQPPCAAYCPTCGTFVVGAGKLIGTHSCWDSSN